MVVEKLEGKPIKRRTYEVAGHTVEHHEWVEAGIDQLLLVDGKWKGQSEGNSGHQRGLKNLEQILKKLQKRASA